MRLSLSLVLFLAACSATATPVVVNKTPIIKPASPAPIKLKPVEFAVLTKDTTIDGTYYGLTIPNYKNLTYNTHEMLRYIKDQKAENKYYETILEGDK